MKVLIIAEQCNPEWASVPLEAWNYFSEISKFVDVTLVTHERNREAIQKTSLAEKAVYIAESDFIKNYHESVAQLLKFIFRDKQNWPVYHLLSYPVYGEFNHQVYQQFKDEILAGKYDVVHALTPMMPRYPVKTIRACKNTPFLLGPVNGGVPFPKGFQEKAREEFAYLNFIRALGRFFIPGYVQTYKQANKVLAGSTYTLEMLKNLFRLPEQQLELFYENGIPKSFLTQPRQQKVEKDRVNLIFVGRLVPYKCADIVIEAIGKLDSLLQQKLSFTIVGDGSEKARLEARVEELNLTNIVHFAGWVDHQKTLEYYSQSDIFCFPSIREFGGAVVLEAMACGLPCIVANNGGIGEYVTDATGFRIDPISRDYLTAEMANKIKVLVEDELLRSQMAEAAFARAQEFEWEAKAKKIVAVYEELTGTQSPSVNYPIQRVVEFVPDREPVAKDPIAP
jgi:glycosyltransferase involved in cell wall biosynthesis